MAAKTYTWPDGSKGHTIPSSTHQKHLDAKKPKKSQLDRVLGWDPSHLTTVLGMTGIALPDFKKMGRFQQAETFRQAYDAYTKRNDPGAFAAPMTPGQANTTADAAANLKYGPQEQGLNQQIKQTPVWFQQYKDSLEGSRLAAQRYQQGLVDQSKDTATQIGQTVLGQLAPGSPAAQQDQLAAQSRQGLAGLGTDLIRAGGAANDAYFGARPGIADAAQIQALTTLLGQKRQLQSDKADYRTGALNDLRTQASNTFLAGQTLGNTINRTQADIAIASGKDPVTGKDLPKDPEKPITSGVFAGLTGSQVTALTPEKRQEMIDAYNKVTHPPKTTTPKDPDALTPTQKRAADAKKQKHITDVHAATGKLKTKITDIIDYRQTDVGGLTDDTSKPKDPITGDYPTRKATQADIDREKLRKYGKLGEIAIAIRSGKKLTAAQITYLKQLDPNYRIPREWTADRTQAQDPHSTGKSGSDKAPGAHGHI